MDSPFYFSRARFEKSVWRRVQNLPIIDSMKLVCKNSSQVQDKKSSRDRPKRSSETKTTSGSKKRDRKSRTSRSVKPKVSAKPIKSEPIDIEPYKTNSKDEFKHDLIKRLSNAVGQISKIFTILYVTTGTRILLTSLAPSSN